MIVNRPISGKRLDWVVSYFPKWECLLTGLEINSLFGGCQSDWPRSNPLTRRYSFDLDYDSHNLHPKEVQKSKGSVFKPRKPIHWSMLLSHLPRHSRSAQLFLFKSVRGAWRCARACVWGLDERCCPWLACSNLFKQNVGLSENKVRTYPNPWPYNHYHHFQWILGIHHFQTYSYITPYWKSMEKLSSYPKMLVNRIWSACPGKVGEGRFMALMGVQHGSGNIKWDLLAVQCPFGTNMVVLLSAVLRF